MNINNDFTEVIKKRASVNDEWAEGVEKCWKEMTDVFSKDIETTIRFLNEECTADEFSWLSEVFDRIAEQTRSMRFIEALRTLAQKYPDETQNYNIISFIDEAQAIVEGCTKKDVVK